ncbi:MAG: hypothetical protein ACYSW8_18680 [Planctomycetota bacterium]|jgi:hypothetical protein
MKKLLAYMVALFAVVGLLNVAESQDGYGAYLDKYINGETASQYVTALDTDTALLIKYVGSSKFAKVAVAGTGTSTITFTQDNTDGTTADTTLECPVSAPLGGVIDQTNANCNTLGEIVDIINASTDWRAVILDGYRTDDVNGTNGDLVAQAATLNVMNPAGIAVLRDTSVGTAEYVTRALTNKRDMTHYVSSNGTLISNPFADFRTVVMSSISNLDLSAAGTFKIDSVKVTHKAAGSETVTTHVNRATQDAAQDNFSYLPFGLFGKKGEKVVLRHSDAGAIVAATTWSVWGLEYEFAR